MLWFKNKLRLEETKHTGMEIKVDLSAGIDPMAHSKGGGADHNDEEIEYQKAP